MTPKEAKNYVAGTLEREQPYERLLRQVVLDGELTHDRTGVGTLSTFGTRMEFNLQDGFPLVTTKKVFLRGIIAELLWFIAGDNKVSTLQKQNVRIWDEWVLPDGTIGNGYPIQWRSWPKTDGTTVDQLSNALDLIRHNPSSRRIIVSAWNAGELDEMALPPCHALFQFHVRGDGFLDCQLYQRSADWSHWEKSCIVPFLSFVPSFPFEHESAVGRRPPEGVGPAVVVRVAGSPVLGPFGLVEPFIERVGQMLQQGDFRVFPTRSLILDNHVLTVLDCPRVGVEPVVSVAQAVFGAFPLPVRLVSEPVDDLGQCFGPCIHSSSSIRRCCLTVLCSTHSPSSSSVMPFSVSNSINQRRTSSTASASPSRRSFSVS